MSSSATWTFQTNIGQISPDSVVKAVTKLKSITDSADSVIKVIQGVVNVVSVYITSPSDILVKLLEQGTKIFTTMVQDVLGIGGQFIVITPFNRMNHREINLLSSKKPVMMPAMTPAEAFKELQYSFTNINDPYRPQWGKNTYIAGCGLLITAPDPGSLVSTIQLLNNLFNIDEFTKIIPDMTKRIESTWSDGRLQHDEDIKGIFNISKISSLTEDTSKAVSNVTKSFAADFDVIKKSIATGKIATLSTMPKLHWYGLSLANFRILNEITEGIKKIGDYLTAAAKAADSAIKDLINAIVNKINTLKKLIDTISALLQAFILSTSQSGIYAFTIPKGTGGYQYVMSCINNSLSKPSSEAAKTVSGIMNSANFSSLLFFSSGFGVNFDAWNALFDSMMSDVNAYVKSMGSSLSIQKYSVYPDFKANPIIKFGTTFGLRVSSPHSTDDNPYYYSFTITDLVTNEIIVDKSASSIFDIHNMSVVNKSTTNITINLPDSNTISRQYKLQITLKNSVGTTSSYTATFTATNAVSSTEALSTSSVPKATDSIKSVVFKDSDGNIIKTSSIGSDGEVPLIGVGDKSIGSLEFIDNNDCVIPVPVVDTTGYTIVEASLLSTYKLANRYYFSSFPGMLKLTFDGSIFYKLKDTDTWYEASAPGFIEVEEGYYQYKIYNSLGCGDVYMMQILEGEEDPNRVCG